MGSERHHPGLQAPRIAPGGRSAPTAPVCVTRPTWPTQAAGSLPAKPTALKLHDDTRQYRNAFWAYSELKRCKAIDARSGRVRSNAFVAFGQYVDEKSQRHRANTRSRGYPAAELG
jgi:hypothetical protein